MTDDTLTHDAFDLRDHIPGAAGMVGAAANVVMQLGAPGVGYGVAESRVDSGNVMLHPWKRLRTTLTYLVVAMFGSAEDRRIYREAVDSVHRFVRSDEQSPVKYNAFDPALQLWVAACLYVGVRDMRLVYLGPMSDDDADALYRHSARLGTTLQVPPEAWPADRAAFEEYWQAGLASLTYDETVRTHLMKVVDLGMLPRWMRIGSASVNRFFTTGHLPPECREGMRLPWSPRRQQRFDQINVLLRLVSRLTPRFLRVIGVHVLLWDMRHRARKGRSLV